MSLNIVVYNTANPYTNSKKQLNKYIIQTKINMKELLNKNTIICCQEVIEPLKESLKDDYNIYGRPRHDNNSIFKHIKLGNESNSIITKKQSDIKIAASTTNFYKSPDNLLLQFVINKETPFRTATIVTTELGCQKIDIINTHLDPKNEEFQRKQLQELYNMLYESIKNDKQIILTGKFNLSPSHKYMVAFMHELSKLGILAVPIDDPTNKKSDKITSYIFTSSGLIGFNYGILKKDEGEYSRKDEVISTEIKTK